VGQITDFFTFKDAQADLAIAALNCIVALAPISADPALTLEDPTDGGLDIPVDYVSLGHFEKKAGVTLTTDIQSKDIEAYGESDPIRTIISTRKISFDFAMYQNGKAQLELFNGTTYADVVPSAFGGVVLPLPPTPKNIYYRAIIVGLDDRNDHELWAYWLLPKVKLSKVDNQQLNDDGVIEYHPTLTAFKDDVLGYSVAQGFAGPGWRGLVSLTGFAPELTALSMATTSALTVAAGAGHTQQLTVLGDNGINYTPDAVFTSSAPTKATVSSSGLVTGVSAGTSSVTATVGSLTTAPCVVTVS
jgi:hypothetical protein